uniref:Uncharacterized protein n=1 Tax=Anguilla anguilla TaxID=7936 RepID=A0A0E9VZX7_ANGAN
MQAPMKGCVDGCMFYLNAGKALRVKFDLTAL